MHTKVQIFWEGHKNLPHLQLTVWRYKVMWNKKWKMSQIFVALSEILILSMFIYKITGVFFSQLLVECTAGTHLGPILIWAPDSFGPQHIWAPTHLGPGTFGPRLIWAPTHLGPNSFGPRLIWSPTHLGPNTFGPQLIWALTHLGPNSFTYGF